MLIDSIKALNFKPINFQSKKSPLLKPNYCDTFERSATCAAANPISFGHKYKGFPKVGGDRKKQLENFIESKSLKGDMEGACACLALNLTNKQVSGYNTIKNKYPNLSAMQAALCAKAKLNDEQTAKYVSIVSSPIKYVDGNNEEQEWEIPVDEAILCVKENFDESKLKRYAQLRNRVVDLKDKSVRGTGKSHNYRPQYVLSAVKEDKTDKQIKQETLFYEGMVKYELETADAITYAQLPAKQRSRFIEGINTYNLVGYRALGYAHQMESEEQRKRFFEGISTYNLDVYDALKYAQLESEEQRKRFFEGISTYNLVGYYALEYAQLESEEQRKRFTEGISTYNLDVYDALKYAQMESKEQRKRFFEGISTYDLDTYDALGYAHQMESEEQRKRFIECINIYNLNVYYALKYAQLESEEQRKRFDEGISTYNLDSFTALKYAQLESEEQRKRFAKGINTYNMDSYEAIGYAELENEEQRKNCLNLIKKENLLPFEAIALARAGIKSLTPETFEQIPDNVWYSMQTGATKEVHDTMQKAIKLCLNPPVEIEKVKPVSVKDLELASTLYKNSTLEHNNGEFSVELQKAEADNQLILIVKDKNSTDKFVVYKGAVAYVAPLVEIDKEKVQQEMKPHSNLLPEKQAPILTQAIQEFVVDITDEDKGCVISKGLEGIIQTGNGITQDDLKPCKGSDKTFDETQNYYLKIIDALDKQGQLNAKNLLRMFPEDSILSINPYSIKTNGSNILYSISCEWRDKEDVHWEMRIHSTDLSDANGATTADKWVFRLGYKIEQQGENNIKGFLRKDPNGAGYDFEGKFKGPDSKDSHIEFISPIKPNNLLNNIDFQKDIRNISMALHGEYLINTLYSNIPTKTSGNVDYYDKASEVVKYAMANPIFYFENQEDIDELRAMLKLPDLKNVA